MGDTLSVGSWDVPTRDPQMEVLLGICHAFGSVADIDEALWSSVRWIRSAVSSEDAPVRISIVSGGRSETLVRAGTFVPRLDRSLRAHRRRARETKRPVIADINGSSDVLAIMPLVSRGALVAVLEVLAPGEIVRERWATLEAVASQIAMAIRNLQERRKLKSSIEALSDPAGLLRVLLSASTPEEAVRAGMAFCCETFHCPTAAWIWNPARTRFEVVGVRGMGSERGKRLRNGLRTISSSSGELEDRQAIVDKFRSLAEVESAEVIDAGEAIIILGMVASTDARSLHGIGPLLSDVLRGLTVVAKARLRNERLDLGIAWTAHELKGPLTAARALMDRLLLASDAGNSPLLARCRDELSLLTELVESLLRWSTGDASLSFEAADLVRITRQAIDSCSLEMSDNRVLLEAPNELPVEIDAAQTRMAIANVVRNALIYSPRDQKVVVKTWQENGSGRIVVGDRGPGIVADEVEHIFDPFTRGRLADTARAGKGLGLFIARRVIEAQGGRVWAEPSTQGARVHIRLPRSPARPMSDRDVEGMSR